MFETFYNSVWQQPVLLGLPSLLFLIALGRRFSPTFLALWAAIFCCESIIDAVVTGPLLQHSRFADTAVATAAAIVFVILGDFRLFVLVEKYSHPARSWWPVFGRATAWALVVPIAQAALIYACPEWFQGARWTYLAYELLFIVWVLILRFVLVPRRAVSDISTHKWLLGVLNFSLIYYALWALADIVILASQHASSGTGTEFGFALRVVPNVMYYGLLMPFAYYTAPRTLRQ